MKPFIFFVILISSFACREMDLDVFDPSIFYEVNARIYPGYGIDGVLLGHSPAKVKDILGEPSSIFNWDAVNDGGIGESYDTPKHKGLSVYYSQDANNFNITFVQSIIVKDGYDGKTKEGIGIGSPVDEVIKYYGEPNKRVINTEKHHFDLYCINSRQFSIGYLDNKIVSISIHGYLQREGDIILCK